MILPPRNNLIKCYFVLIAMLLLASSVLAQTRPVRPQILYLGGFDEQGKYVAFKTPEAAYALAEAWRYAHRIRPEISHSFNFRPTTPPLFSNTYINGQISKWIADFYSYPGSGISQGVMVTVSWECPQPKEAWYEQDIGPVWKQGEPVYHEYICVPKTPVPELDDCNNDCHNKKVGKPIYLGVGVEKFSEVDYVGVGASDLKFNRTYRSDRGLWANNHQTMGVDITANSQAINDGLEYSGCYKGIGQVLKTEYCFPYVKSGLANDFMFQRGHGRRLFFGTATNLDGNKDVNDRLSRNFDANGNLMAWTMYRAADNATEYFDLTGRLQKVVARSGQTQTYTYSDASTPVTTAPRAGLLIRITDHFGRQLNFTYDGARRLKTMTDPAGGTYTYAYDEATSYIAPGKFPVDNLTSVTYPDGKRRLYWYNEQANTGNTDLPSALTGITDENGIRYSTIKYDKWGFAISTELAGGIDKYQMTYPTWDESQVIDPLGTASKYYFSNILGVSYNRTIFQASGAGSAASIQRNTFDGNGNLVSKNDFNGVTTTYTYDLSRNLETKRVEASGTAKQRTTTTGWHTVFRLPVIIHEPLRRTIYTYDTNGNVLTKTEQTTNDTNGSLGSSAAILSQPRVWTYTYNSIGQVLTATGPRTDVNDVTTYAYDTQGNLISVTNPAGHVTTMSNYDAHGHVGTITDPNGVVTNLTYHVRGWLLSRAVTADGITETTTYTYDGVGQMTKVTLPDNSTVNYTYDDAHRLTRISDHLGNSINYTLDNMGNRIKEEVKDTTGALTRQVTRVYDALSRLKEVTGAAQ